MNSRQKILKQAKTIVVKVGSAVLTKLINNKIEINLGIIDGLAKQLANLHKRGLKIVLVTSGAVATGRNTLAKADISDELVGLSAKQAAAAVGQAKLMHLYEQSFGQHNIVSAQVLLTRDDLKDRERFLNIRNTFATLLNWGIIPIVNENDTVSVNELKFSDNDNLASLLLNVVEADVFINLTSIGGVLDKNPLKYADAKIMPIIEDISTLNLDDLCGGKSLVGTGGMYSKLLAAHRAAQLGVPSLILAGLEPDIILKAFNDNIGTWISPKEQNISRRKYWLAYKADPKGSIIIDTGAAKALIQKGSSLLSVGIVEAKGSFQVGDLVSILHDHKNIGVGLINYDIEAINKIKGLKRNEVAMILGNAEYPEVIHRDNLLLDAAV